MNKKKYILLILLYFTLINVKAQNIGPNLAANPSFEDYYQCPWSNGQLYYAKNWWGLSTEYYTSCATFSGVSVPFNMAGLQNPKTGIAYAGFVLYAHSSNSNDTNTTTETIKNKLNDSLIKNKQYCINYYVSLAEYTYKVAAYNNSIILFDSISAMFSVNQVLDGSTPLMCDSCSKFSKSIVNLDTLSWFRISGSIIAKGGEKYLTLGKFYNINWAPNISCQFYVYVDDVSLCECAYNLDLGADTVLCKGDTKILKATLTNATYEWQDGSTNPTYIVTQPGTYWVRAYVAEYDITTTDTITITAEDENICNPPLIIPNFITPNGDDNNDNFKIGNADKYELNLQIFNRWGNMIYQNANYQNDFNCNECADGVYYYLLRSKSKRNGNEKEDKGSVTVMK